jgi:hypothetical protein
VLTSETAIRWQKCLVVQDVGHRSARLKQMPLDLRGVGFTACVRPMVYEAYRYRAAKRQPHHDRLHCLDPRVVRFNPIKPPNFVHER